MNREDLLAERFVDENIRPYSAFPIPIDPGFVRDAGTFLAGWAAGKALAGGVDAAYEFLRKKLGSSEHERRAVKRGASVQPIRGAGRELTLLRVGRRRPWMRIEAGRIAKISDLTILFSSSPAGCSSRSRRRG